MCYCSQPVETRLSECHPCPGCRWEVRPSGWGHGREQPACCDWVGGSREESKARLDGGFSGVKSCESSLEVTYPPSAIQGARQSVTSAPFVACGPHRISKGLGFDSLGTQQVDWFPQGDRALVTQLAFQLLHLQWFVPLPTPRPMRASSWTWTHVGSAQLCQ